MTQGTTHSAADNPLPSPKERRRLREAKSMSEQEVAAAVGVTRATVRAWEKGRSEPRGRRREVYARLLECPGRAPGTEGSGSGLAPEAGAEAGHAPDAGAEVLTPAQPAAAAGAGAGTGATAEATGTTPAEPEVKAEAQAEPEAQAQAKAQAEGKGEVKGKGKAEAKAEVRLKAGGAIDARSDPASAGGPGGTASPEKPGQPHSLTRPAPAVKRAARPAPSHPPRTAPPVVHPAARPERPAPPPDAPPEPVEKPGPDARPVPGVTSEPGMEQSPADAFDALYAHAAPGLVRQAYLLSGRRRLSHESVERAFHLAWQSWPEVARDRDPVGWVRIAAYECAMSPWQRLRPSHRHPDSPPLDPERRALLDALLELPPPYRRTLVLYDGLGLDLPETAAETEASTPATANRLLNARQAIARRLGLGEPDSLHDLLTDLADACPVPQPAPARSVREGSERVVWFWTRTALTLTALIIGATGFTLVTADRSYQPEVAPGQRVSGIPPHAGPQRLTEGDRKLRDRLRSEPAHGPGRLVPRIP
ncbi:sigma factor-like helix-turn-helix DNA-binding protein [Streptomyces sp. NPDC001889]